MTSIIGPRRANGWKELFGYKEQFGTGTTVTTGTDGGTVLNPFYNGTGTLFPFASMPAAQAWRYYWTVKQWRIRINMVSTGTPPIVLDTGFIPYPCGYNSGAGGIQQRATFTGDRLATPTLAERYYLPHVGASLFTYYIGSGVVFATISNGSYGGTLSLMGQVYYPPYSKYQNNVRIVIDEAIPGNVFMSFFFTFNAVSTSLAYGSAAVVVGALSLDGMGADLYGTPPTGGSLTATMTIDTKDT